MKFETTPAFDSDYKKLKREHQETFREVIATKFGPACDRFAGDPKFKWPASLRVKSMVNAPGILEMTWSFASPDGRATFEFVTENGEKLCRWRRVGDHGVFKEP